MSWLSKLSGRDKARNNRTEQARRYGDPNDRYNQAIVDEAGGDGWQDEFEQSAGAYMNRAMPQFRQQLQLTREDGIRRGISTGDLGTSYEGDLASAFQQNMSDTLGSMAQAGYENSRGRYLDLLTGRLDRNTAASNNRNRQWWEVGKTGINAGAMAMGGG